VVAVVSDRFPDGTFVDVEGDGPLTPVTAGWSCAAALEDGRVNQLLVAPGVARAAARLWFVEIPESHARPPAVNLMAFTGHGQPRGRLLDAAALTGVGGSPQQLGAVRWYPATGEVSQIYVQPEHRRQGVASALLHAAGVLSVARGWARLWGDGQRTELGEQFRNASYWRHRGADLTHTAPPMTPPE
jgi:GNAT superfamily N-acetyltransferase